MVDLVGLQLIAKFANTLQAAQLLNYLLKTGHTDAIMRKSKVRPIVVLS